MTDDVLAEEQCSFRCGRGCVDQRCGVRQLSEKFLAEGKEAYDRVDKTHCGRC